MLYLKNEETMVWTIIPLIMKNVEETDQFWWNKTRNTAVYEDFFSSKTHA